MPGWPNPAERRALDAFPEQIGAEDLDEHFKLSQPTCGSRSGTAATAGSAWRCSCACCAGWGSSPMT